jgi:dTMP kinase
VAEPQRFLVLDATLPVDELQQSIRHRVSELLD